jgi:hypothetical protein
MTQTNFIEQYDGVFSKEFCEQVIFEFEKHAAAGFVMTRQQRENDSFKLDKDDSSLFFCDMPEFHLPVAIGNEFMRQWRIVFDQYIQKYQNGMRQFDQLGIYTLKVQKTTPGQGYHIWHHECGKRITANRVLAFTVYLNDVEDGGETEFIHQSTRVSPKMGRVAMWPAGFTHTHRGNPPLSGDKYIITGWVEL